MSRILIADDNSRNLYLLETILKSNGHDVTCAANGAEAFELACQAPPDLVITDILMPVMDGFELCRQWKKHEQLRHIPFVFYTATFTDPKDEQFALSLGAERYVSKPQRLEDLLRIVQELLHALDGKQASAAAEQPGGEVAVLRQYNEVLFRKLEKKVVELEGEIGERTRVEEHLRQALDEVQRLRDQLQQENVYLREQVTVMHGHSRIVGSSAALQRVLSQAEQVATTDSTVLLLGETGTGKELLAMAIHELSPRCEHTMVCVNCAAMPAPLIESELFGHEKGAFTGALSRKSGRFETANGSTIFLDEIGELPPDIQVKLLRVLQGRQIERLGSSTPIPVDVRVIAASNRDLEKAVREGRFRDDLYYRLNVFPITIPPLRERRDDIPLLVWAFVEEFAKTFGKNIASIPQSTMDALVQYGWPGNIRELRNVVERAMIVSSSTKLHVELPAAATAGRTRSLSMQDAEREHIISVLDMAGWRVRGAGGAADLLQLKPTTLQSRMIKLGIKRPESKRETR